MRVERWVNGELVDTGEDDDPPLDPRDERIAALERALIEKSVITEQELTAARTLTLKVRG